MTAFNVVRFRVRPGRDQEFLDAHKKIEATWRGLIHANTIKTGDRFYCITHRQLRHGVRQFTLPIDWDSIEVGDLVIAIEDLNEGWWEAIVKASHVRPALRQD
jgi:hypothetical protein